MCACISVLLLLFVRGVPFRVGCVLVVRPRVHCIRRCCRHCWMCVKLCVCVRMFRFVCVSFVVFRTCLLLLPSRVVELCSTDVPRSSTLRF